jgi:hypothetical protein
MVEVNLDTITAGESVDVWHPICPTKGCMNPKGELHLVVTWEPLEEQTPGLVARTAAKATKVQVKQAPQSPALLPGGAPKVEEVTDAELAA